MARKTKRDWWIAGIEILTTVGPSGLTIDNLCQQLTMTKGSFYHHFGGIDDFKEQLLAYYEEEGTLDIIEQLTAVSTPLGKFKGLLDIIVEASIMYTTYPEATIRAWALHDEMVRAVQTRVDARRLAYVEALLQEILNDPIEAKIKAQITYTILVGAEQMQPPVIGEELRALYDTLLPLLGIE